MKTLYLTASHMSKASSGSSPIRLLKVLTTFFSGGTEGQVLNLARNLDRQQFDLRLACFRKDGNMLEEFEKLQVPISEFRIKKLYHPQTYLQQLRFASHLRQQRIQIVHAYNFYANVFALPAARLAGVPVVLASIRDRGVYLTSAQKKAQKWACSFADRVMVNCDSIRDWLLEQGYQTSRIEVIKNGIDMSLYTGRLAGSKFREELGIAESAPIIMLLSRLNRQKGVDDFIKAASRLKDSHPDARFVIVGSKLQYVPNESNEVHQYMTELKQLAQSLDVERQVIFAGSRKDTPAVLAEAAISVLPSYSEGLSNSILESMAAGIPTVATAVGGNPELIKENVNGLLVPVQSPVALALAIAKILDNPLLAKRLGKKARQMASESFSLTRMVAATEALYLDHLSHSKRAILRH